jgi:endonuclease YncB( thermonuclease family)
MRTAVSIQKASNSTQLALAARRCADIRTPSAGEQRSTASPIAMAQLSPPPADAGRGAIARALALRDRALAAGAELPGGAAFGARPARPAKPPSPLGRWSDEYARGAREVALGAAVAGVLLLALRSGLVRYRVESDIPGRLIRGRATLHGYVMRVTDGDGLRFYHTPWLRRLVRPEMRRMRKVSGETINVRLAGVDAPELSHYGSAEQPFGREAKEFLRGMAERRRASLTIHRLDQYKRVLGTVHVKSENPLMRVLGLRRRNVSMELARAGLAEVYRGPNACYGSVGLRRFEAAQAAAMRKKLGMWSQRRVVTPTEFKAQLRRDALNGPGARDQPKPKGAAMVLFPAAHVLALARRILDVVGLGQVGSGQRRRRVAPAAPKKRRLFW